MRKDIDSGNKEELSDSYSGNENGGSFFARLGRMLTEVQYTGIIRLYRLISLLLSSLLFIISPASFSTAAQQSLLLAAIAFSITMLLLYEHFWQKKVILAGLIIFEIITISILLALTGGFQGAFLWYALNPFIVGTVFFTFSFAWLLLAVIVVSTFGWKLIIFGEYLTFGEIFSNNYFDAINLVVIVLIMQLFARMHISLYEYSIEKKVQQKEIIMAHRNLSSNYEIFKGLSNFQKQILEHSNQKDIYSTLINTIMRLFPLREAVVLIPPSDRRLYLDQGIMSFQIIGLEKVEKPTAETPMLREIEDRWEELSGEKRKQFIVSRNRKWIALPLQGTDKMIGAVLIGWLNQKTNPLAFTDNLSLFINFTEQAIAWLTIFKQKERVLQHITSIYEAVEAASSQNDARAVIELFASYAQALTECKKTIFWIENTSGDYGDYHPLVAIKGPADELPEEEWKDAALKIWTNICEHKQPVIGNLVSGSGSPAQMIGVPVKSGKNCFGMLIGINLNSKYTSNEIIQTLITLADLAAIAVERSRTEIFAEKLLIIEEQKRIASEIHDTISQNLFSIVYSIDALVRENGAILQEEISRSLSDIKALSAETARELRALIYRLSPRQEKNESFIREISRYLDQISRMNQVEIIFGVEGQSEHLNSAACKTYYRVIKEAAGNALRHSRCSKIEVNLAITPYESTLKVRDNGKGFNIDLSSVNYTSGNRLGLVNMREMALALKGTLNIVSNPGEGTEVTCSIPTSLISVS